MSQAVGMISPMEWEDRLRVFAETQEGLVARFHARQLGCTAQQWWRAGRTGRWESLSPRVLRLVGSTPSDAQRVLAAVLDASPGAVLHGRSALAWQRMRGFNLRHIAVARPNGLSGTPPALARLHRLRDLRAHDVIVVRGVPTETALRAIWVEAARYATPALADVGLQKIGRLVDEAHRKGLVTWAALHEMVEALHERGRSGTAIMRACAEERPPGSSPTESRNEEQLEKVLANAGIPSLVRQVVVGGQEPIGRVDFRDGDLPLAVEVNSLTFHTTPSDRRADGVRYRRLNDAGFTVGVIWEDDLWSNAGELVRMVNRVREHARRGRRIVVHSPSCPWSSPDAEDPPRFCVRDISLQRDIPYTER